MTNSISTCVSGYSSSGSSSKMVDNSSSSSRLLLHACTALSSVITFSLECLPSDLRGVGILPGLLDLRGATAFGGSSGECVWPLAFGSSLICGTLPLRRGPKYTASSGGASGFACIALIRCCSTRCLGVGRSKGSVESTYRRESRSSTSFSRSSSTRLTPLSYPSSSESSESEPLACLLYSASSLQSSHLSYWHPFNFCPG